MWKPIQSLYCLQSEVGIFQITVHWSFNDTERGGGFLSKWQKNTSNQYNYDAFDELWWNKLSK